MQYFFITGTSQGIGHALATRILQEENTSVFGFSRRNSIQHDRYQHTHVDLSDMEGLKQDIHKFFPDLPDASRIVLVNNAGTLGEVKYMGNIANEQIPFLFNLNVTAPAILMNHFLRIYQAQRVEKIILNVSSGAGKYPVDGWSGYCASKAAVDMLSQVLALELQKRSEKGESLDCKVYALAPGVVDTGMQEKIRELKKDDFSELDKFLDLKKEGNLDEASQTAKKIMYLLNHSEQFEDVLQDVRKF